MTADIIGSCESKNGQKSGICLKQRKLVLKTKPDSSKKRIYIINIFKYGTYKGDFIDKISRSI